MVAVAVAPWPEKLNDPPPNVIRAPGWTVVVLVPPATANPAWTVGPPGTGTKAFTTVIAWLKLSITNSACADAHEIKIARDARSCFMIYTPQVFEQIENMMERRPFIQTG